MARRIKVKPGKGQSKMGFVVGIIFVLIGVFFAIPTFGLFGVFWTAVAGFIAYSHYKNGFSDEGMATHEIIIDDDNATYDHSYTNGYGDYEAPNTSGDDIEAKLKKLDSLYNQGLITSEEYEQKRKEFLDEF